MEKKIILQKLNWNYIYFLLYIITIVIQFCILYNTSNILPQDKLKEITYYYASTQMLNTYISLLSYFIAIIPFLITKKYTNKPKENEKIDNSNINMENNNDDEPTKLIYNNLNEIEKSKRDKKNKIYYFLVSLCEFLYTSLFIIFYMIYPNETIFINSLNCSVPYYVIIQYILSYLILKMHFYKFHYFSFALNIIIFIILLIMDLVNSLLYEIFDIKIYIIYLFLLIFNAVEYCFGKKLLLNGFISPYNLLIIIGIFNSIMIFIFSIIILIIDKNIFVGIGIYLSNIKSILVIISKIILNFFNHLFLWIIIDRFSPNHFPLALIFQEFSGFIFDFIYYKDELLGEVWDICIRIVLYIILFIGVMMHNEIIIINICGLGSYTKYFLRLKSINENLYLERDTIDNLIKYDTLEEKDIQIDDFSKDDIGENRNTIN